MNIVVNPILTGFNPDPSIVRVGKDYFLVTSSFEYFPGAPIYHSTDLIHWTLIGHALTRTSQIQIHTPEPGGGVWATTIRYHDGTFYVMAASFDRYRPQEDDRVWPRGFYVKTQNIWNSASWSDPVYFDQIGFDQDLFWDDDGTVYLSTTYRKINRTPGATLKDFAIHVCTVDLVTGNSTSEPRLVRESPSGIAEGSHLYKRGKYYYLFTAEGGTESQHSEVVHRSVIGPFGPWEAAPQMPLWQSGHGDEVRNTGHADLVEDAHGRWWAVLLGIRPMNKEGEWEASVFGRESFLIPVEWVDNWPVFNNGKSISLAPESSLLDEEPSSVYWRDDFKEPKLQLGWYRKNTPIKEDYSITADRNHLRLYGGPYNLSVPACPTLFLRKQQNRSCIWQTRLSFNPTTEGVEAGTVLWWNYFTYSSLGIRKKGNTRVIRFRPAEGNPVDRDICNNGQDVVFVIECGRKYRFGFRMADNHHRDISWIGEVSNQMMTKAPPVGAPFTGMMLGLYAFGERQRCLTPADFHYVEIR